MTWWVRNGIKISDNGGYECTCGRPLAHGAVDCSERWDLVGLPLCGNRGCTYKHNGFAGYEWRRTSAGTDRGGALGGIVDPGRSE